MSEQDKLLLTPEEMTEIRVQVPESERIDIQGLIQRYLKAQVAKLKAMGYVKLDLDKLTVIKEVDGSFTGRDTHVAIHQFWHTKKQLKEILTGG